MSGGVTIGPDGSLHFVTDVLLSKYVRMLDSIIFCHPFQPPHQ